MWFAFLNFVTGIFSGLHQGNAGHWKEKVEESGM